MTRYRFACTRTRNSATARMAPFLISASPPRSFFRNWGAVFRVRHQDLHLFEARKIDGRLRFHLLIDAENPLDDVGHLGNRYPLREAAPVAARDQNIALFYVVGPLNVLDAHDVP